MATPEAEAEAEADVVDDCEADGLVVFVLLAAGLVFSCFASLSDWANSTSTPGNGYMERDFLKNFAARSYCS